MESLKGLETKLDEMLVKNAPFQMPKGYKKWVGNYAWVLVLIAAVFGAFGFLGLLGLVGIVSTAAVVAGVGQNMFFVWLALLVLGVQVALYIMAISPLKAKQKRGWDLIFIATLVSAVFGLFNWLSSTNWASNVFNLIWNLFWVVVSLYLLFQVRTEFTKKA